MKTSNSIALQYEDLTVHFTGEAWFNATEAAAKFGKKPITWLNLKSTKAYLIAFEQKNTDLKVSKSIPLKIIKGNLGGTWMHPRLGIVFARWLDVRFAVWCDEQIYNLLKGTHTYSNPPRQEVTTGKRKAALPMLDTLEFTRELLGKETVTHHYTNEHLFCNRALTGDWKPIEESALDNYDLKLLEAIRRHNAVLIPHFPGQKGERRKRLDEFVADYRAKRPRLYLVTK